jgi:hypothetical protein
VECLLRGSSRHRCHTEDTVRAISALFVAAGRKQRRKLLQFVKNVLFFSPYGYSKEKCILPSCS